MAKIVLVEIGIAAAVFPAASPVSAIVYVNQCDPENIIKTGIEALDLYDRLSTVRSDLDAAVAALPAEKWQGQDRVAFEEHIDDYRREILGLQTLAMMMGVALLTVSLILLVMVVTYAIIATVLAVLAVMFMACLDGVRDGKQYPPVLRRGRRHAVRAGRHRRPGALVRVRLQQLRDASGAGDPAPPQLSHRDHRPVAISCMCTVMKYYAVRIPCVPITRIGPILTILMDASIPRSTGLTWPKTP